MSDDTKDFHDEWQKFLSEEELDEGLRDLAKSAGSSISRGLGKAKRAATGAKARQAYTKAGDALSSAWSAAGKNLQGTGKTLASKVGAGAQGQLSFADQEKAWAGMAKLPDWTDDPEEVEKQYIIANSKNLARLDNLFEIYVTLDDMSRRTGIKDPLLTVNGLLFWWKGRQTVTTGAGAEDAFAALAVKINNMKSVFENPEIELNPENEEEVVITPQTQISAPMAIDIIVFKYLNERYKEKSYKDITDDWRDGVKELNKLLFEDGGLYDDEKGPFGAGGKPPGMEGTWHKPYGIEPAKGMIQQIKKVFDGAQKANKAIGKPSAAPFRSGEPPADTADVAAENIERALEAELLEMFSPTEIVDEKLRIPKRLRRKKKQEPPSAWKEDFILNQPFTNLEESDITKLKGFPEAAQTVLPLYNGMKKMWDSTSGIYQRQIDPATNKITAQRGQGLNPKQQQEMNEAFGRFAVNLQVMMQSQFKSYVGELLKMWKLALDTSYKTYADLRMAQQAAKKAAEEESADGPEASGEESPPELEPIPTDEPPVATESIENKWKRLALS